MAHTHDSDLSSLVYILNQTYALKRRLRNCQLPPGTLRPLERIEEHLEHNLRLSDLPAGSGLTIDDPLGQKYDERRSDLEAEVISDGDGPPIVVDVLKPIIRLSRGGQTDIIQRGVVTVSHRKAEENET